MQEESRRRGHSDYLDFELEVGIGSGREYPVTVLRSPAGEGHATMHFPFDDVALDLRLGKLQVALLRSGGKHRRAPSEEEQAVQDFGRSLFDALFSRRVRTCYDVSLREATQQDKGLRLKLRIRPPELSALPWELLYNPDQAEYVCLSRQTPIVRYLESPRLIRPLTVSPPLRILGMVASPWELSELDIEREKQRVERATGNLRERGLLELEWLPGQTWSDLQEAMWGGPWHVFHFIGHGGFNVHADEGFIALADREGRRSDLTATRLSRLLADHSHLRLVLLNACEGARGSERDIYSSTASILVHRGIPAVLAMQYEITDQAAIEFARAFYRALAHGMAVDEAVVAARKAIDLAVTNSIEWGTPVLYMRTPDGVLFHVTGAPRARASAPPTPPDRKLERRLEQRYTAGLSAWWLEDWDEACGHFQAIVDERPDYQDASDKLAEARRQKKWSELYEQAQAARKAENWAAALSSLEDLVAEKPDYKDSAALLEATKRRVHLADLYAQARRLGQAQEWQAVVNVFAQIAALDPEYRDPEGLLPAAKQEMAEQAQRAQLDHLYSRAVREMDAGQWREARQFLRQLQEHEPGYLETERLLARAEAEIEREQMAGLYAEAQALADAGQWRPALDRLGQIRDLDPQFPDAEGIDAQARLGLDREEKKAQRQRELAALYAEAVALLQAKRFQEALDKWAEVQAIDPAYPDGKKVQPTALKKLASRDGPTFWRRLPRGVWVAIGVVVLSAILIPAGVVLWPSMTATPTPAPADTVEVEKTVIEQVTGVETGEVTPEVTVVETVEVEVEVTPVVEEDLTALPREETMYFNGLQWGPVACWNPYSSSCNNPLAIYEVDSAGVTMFETPYLFNMLDGGQYPLLADGPYEWNDERTEITYKIKNAATWSDGTPVTAEDAAYTWATHVKYGTNAGSANGPYIDTIEAVDDKTVVIKAKLNDEGQAVNPLIVQAYVSSNYIIQKAWTQTLEERVGKNQTAFMADTAEDVVYSGPYHKFFADDQKVVLVRDDNYWGQDASMWGKLPVPKYLAHTIFKDSAAGSAALAKGEVDVSQQFHSNIQLLWENDGLPISTYLPEAPYGIGASLLTAFYNLKAYGLDHPAVRKAIAIAVDYPTIIANAMTNQSATFEQVPRSLMNPSPGEQAMYDHEAVADLQWAGNDVEGAKALLDEAGIVDTDGDGWREYNGEKLSYVATCPNGWSDWQAAIEVVAAAGAEIGIDITTNYPEWLVYSTVLTASDQDLPEGYDIFMMWSDGAGPTQPWSRIRHLLSSEYVGMAFNWNGNWGQYSNPRVDELIQAILQETDPAKLKNMYTELVKIYLIDIPSFTLMYRPHMFHAVNESVWTGFPHQDDGSDPPIPPMICIDGYSIACLYNLTLVNP